MGFYFSSWQLIEVLVLPNPQIFFIALLDRSVSCILQALDHYYKNLHQDKSRADTSSWDLIYAKNWNRVLVFNPKNPIYLKDNNLHQNSFSHQMEFPRSQTKQMNIQKQWIQITLLSEGSDRLNQNFL